MCITRIVLQFYAETIIFVTFFVQVELYHFSGIVTLKEKI